jgi:hypothetical protein
MKYSLFLFVLFLGCQGLAMLELPDGAYVDADLADSSFDQSDSDFDSSDSSDTSGDADSDSDSDTDSDADTDTDSDGDSDSDSGEDDTDSIFDGLCDFITCPEYPMFNGPEVKFRSLCVHSDFPGVVPDTIMHYAAWSGECFEVVGGYECRYKEHEEECELEQQCGQRQVVGELDYSFGVCLDSDTDEN